MRKDYNLLGKRFGRWTVIKHCGTDKWKSNIWLCRCDCGNERTLSSHNLRMGYSKSCGCYNRDKNLKHGQFGTRLYSTWSNMIERCFNSNDNGYKLYGGRGIKVCDEWRDFSNFYDWSMANGYQDDLTIDRIDVNGNYEPSNCRWATMLQQANNKRNNRVFEINGEKLAMAEIARKYNIHYATLKGRIRKDSDIIKAVYTPIKNCGRKKVKGGD